MVFSKIRVGIIIGLVFFIIFSYAVLLVALSWPIENWSVGSAGMFGDSFGVINSLFSGLAFAAIVITILLQREELKIQHQELKLQHKELVRSSAAQETSARLIAATELLSHYKNNISTTVDILNDKSGATTFEIREDRKKKKIELDELIMKRDSIVQELESLVKNSRET